jgi:hypothetical protein
MQKQKRIDILKEMIEENAKHPAIATEPFEQALDQKRLSCSELIELAEYAELVDEYFFYPKIIERLEKRRPKGFLDKMARKITLKNYRKLCILFPSFLPR